MSGAEGSRKEVIINVDIITESLQRELQDLQAPSNECSIYRVPRRMRNVDNRLYSPKVISIGPLHHGKEELQAMEEHKRLYLQHFIQLSGSITLKEILEFIRGKETQLRNQYAETIRFSSEEFVKLVLVDAAFIILLFLRNIFQMDQLGDDRIFKKPEMIYEITDDLLLLENQLPFFILEDLYEFSKLPEFFQKSYTFTETSDFRDGIEFIKLTHSFLRSWMADREKMKKNYAAKAQHLVQYLKLCQVLPGKHLERKEIKSWNMPSAVELDQAGVKFKPSSNTDLFDIKFRDGILEIPPLEILDSIEILFHNICAFEQCHNITWQSLNHINSTNEECHCVQRLVSDYIDIMFVLVKGPKDAELLIQKEYID